MTKVKQFPAPLEVDRFLYIMKKQIIATAVVFPAPLEVDRFLYPSRV